MAWVNRTPIPVKAENLALQRDDVMHSAHFRQWHGEYITSEMLDAGCAQNIKSGNLAG